MTTQSLISIIMIHYGDLKTTQNALKSLAKKIQHHQLILINNTQKDITNLTKIIPHTQLIDNRQNLGFAKAVNQGIALALTNLKVTHVMLMNNDLQIESGTFNQLLRTYLKHSSAGIVSPVLHHSKNLYDWGGKYSRFSGLVKHINWPNPPKTILTVDHVAGASMLISRQVINEVGNFDERFFLYYEDLDYCLRVKQAGFSLHINPLMIANHTMSAGTTSIKRTIYQWKSHLLFVIKHLPKTVWPTAFLTDIIFYPLVILKSILFK